MSTVILRYFISNASMAILYLINKKTEMFYSISINTTVSLDACHSKRRMFNNRIELKINRKLKPQGPNSKSYQYTVSRKTRPAKPIQLLSNETSTTYLISFNTSILHRLVDIDEVVDI